MSASQYSNALANAARITKQAELDATKALYVQADAAMQVVEATLETGVSTFVSSAETLVDIIQVGTEIRDYVVGITPALPVPVARVLGVIDGRALLARLYAAALAGKTPSVVLDGLMAELEGLFPESYVP